MIKFEFATLIGVQFRQHNTTTRIDFATFAFSRRIVCGQLAEHDIDFLCPALAPYLDWDFDAGFSHANHARQITRIFHCFTAKF